MDGIEKLKRSVRHAAADQTRARAIENLNDEFSHVQQWLEMQLASRSEKNTDELLWIECARRFGLVAEQALRDLEACNDELAKARKKQAETVG